MIQSSKTGTVSILLADAIHYGFCDRLQKAHETSKRAETEGLIEDQKVLELHIKYFLLVLTM